ncbi:MAG: hypothetical protein AAGG38_05165 [Planctomycetota bacterium]
MTGRVPRPVCLGAPSLLVALLAACTPVSEPLPAASWSSLDDAQQQLIQNQNAIQTVQAPATFRLTPPPSADDPDPDPVTLDAALALDGDRRLRLQTWKLNQKVFDLTTVDGQAWVLVSRQAQRRAPGDLKDRLAQLAQRLPALLHGPDFGAADWSDRGDQLRATWPFGFAEIERRTLAPLRFTLRPDPNQPATVIDTRFALYDGLLWHREITARGPFGVIELAFRDVEINRPLNPRVFDPPRRAALVRGIKIPPGDPTAAGNVSRTPTLHSPANAPVSHAPSDAGPDSGSESDTGQRTLP